MNKVLAALVASAFGLISASALADDKTPAQPVDRQKVQAEKMGDFWSPRDPRHQENSLFRMGDFPKKKKQKASDTPSNGGVDRASPKPLPTQRPWVGTPVDRRYLEPPPQQPLQPEPAKGNP